MGAREGLKDCVIDGRRLEDCPDFHLLLKLDLTLDESTYTFPAIKYATTLYKGMLFLLVFGLPPLVHPNDPTRAVLACIEFVRVFKRLDLIGLFGVTTGRIYCGVCGSTKRMEYTVLGDCVNLLARLMTTAPALGILCDEETIRRSTGEITYKAFVPMKVKGKTNSIPIFQPSLKRGVGHIGLTPERQMKQSSGR